MICAECSRLISRPIGVKKNEPPTERSLSTAELDEAAAGKLPTDVSYMLRSFPPIVRCGVAPPVTYRFTLRRCVIQESPVSSPKGPQPSSRP